MNEETKKELLEVAEGLTVETVEQVFKLVEYFIEKSENKIDDMALAFLPQAKSYILDLVDKIDGEKG